MICFGEVPAGSVLPVHFPSYNASGASVSLTGLAVTDVEIYKGITVTQRASDAGIALIDTDGIDIDGITGANGFSIDLSDNTDAGFYAVGSFYTVWVSAVTIDSQTVNFIAATFRIKEAETTAGRIEARVGSIANAAITAAAIATDAIDADAMADGAITAATFAAGAITATVIATDAIDADALAADAVTEIQSGLATQASVDTIDNFLDTEVAAILEDTGTTLPAQIAALENLSAAEVNAEVVDALATDTYAEPGQGAPAATTSLAAKLNYLYKAWRNKKEQTADTHTLYNDDGTTAGQKSTVSDDGTTATRGEMVTGA